MPLARTPPAPHPETLAPGAPPPLTRPPEASQAHSVAQARQEGDLPPPIPTLGAVTPAEVSAALAFVNRGRFQLLRRMSTLRLFTGGGRLRETLQPDDHPLIATILKIRDEFESIPEDTDDARTKGLRMKALETLLSAVATGLKMGESSSEALTGALQKHHELEQRKVEHADKIALLREKLDGASISLEQLENAAAAADAITGATAPAGSLFGPQP